MRMDRGFYSEWGTAEGLNGDAVGSAILVGFSLSDNCDSSRVDNKRAKLGLAGLGVAFGELFERYREAVFRDAVPIQGSGQFGANIATAKPLTAA